MNFLNRLVYSLLVFFYGMLLGSVSFQLGGFSLIFFSFFLTGVLILVTSIISILKEKEMKELNQQTEEKER